MLRSVFEFVLVLLFGQMAYADPPSLTFITPPNRNDFGQIRTKVSWNNCPGATTVELDYGRITDKGFESGVYSVNGVVGASGTLDKTVEAINRFNNGDFVVVVVRVLDANGNEVTSISSTGFTW